MRLNPEEINWNNLKAVIFDVDGTLYDQKRLRRLMGFEIIRACLLNPFRWREARIIYHFRKERERRAAYNVCDIENVQYHWAAEKLGVPPEVVREIVSRWMYQVPLKFLHDCRYSAAGQLMALLKKKGVTTAVFSDYPSAEKLAALKMSCDLIVSATDEGVDRLKPDPVGVLVIMEKLGAVPEECLFIGDRDDRDGECARRAGMNYLIIDRVSADKIYAALVKRLRLAMGYTG